MKAYAFTDSEVRGRKLNFNNVLKGTVKMKCHCKKKLRTTRNENNETLPQISFNVKAIREEKFMEM